MFQHSPFSTFLPIPIPIPIINSKFQRQFQSILNVNKPSWLPKQAHPPEHSDMSRFYLVSASFLPRFCPLFDSFLARFQLVSGSFLTVNMIPHRSPCPACSMLHVPYRQTSVFVTSSQLSTFPEAIPEPLLGVESNTPLDDACHIPNKVPSPCPRFLRPFCWGSS